MSVNFTGVTFANQKVTPAYDAIIRRALLDDGVLTGCELSYSGSTLTMTAGQLMICGRQIVHPASQNWAITEKTTGYARLVLTIDLTRTSTKDTFDQVVDEVQYATAVDGFTALEQSDINAAGSKYQVAACVVSLGPGGITGIVSQLDATEGGGAGGILTVAAPAGVAVTVSKDNKSKSKISGVSGVVVFKGLDSGTWTVSIADGEQSATREVLITADYSVIIAFFAATINITYPSGSVCSATDGTTTLTAPDTSGTWACVVPNAGTWTLSCMDGTESTSESVTITTDGQSISAALSYVLWLYKDGDTCDAVSGGWSAAEYGITGGSFDTVATFGQNDMTIANNAHNGSVFCGNVFTNNSIDLSKINTLKFKITGIGENKTWQSTNSDGKPISVNIEFSLAVASERPSKSGLVSTAKLDILDLGEYSLDVSSVSAGYVGIWIKSGGYVSTTLTIGEIWGEK